MLNPRQQESTTVDAFILLAALELLPSLNAALAAEILLYGVHLVLFALCAYILLRRRGTLQYVILASATIMFALSTADIAISLRLMLKDVPDLLRGKITTLTVTQRAYPKSPIFVANNLISDMLLVYRCYVVWGKRLVIVAISMLLLIADTIWGWIGNGLPYSLEREKYESAYFGSVLAMCTVMTALTAGRIWWVARKTTSLVGRGHLHIYKTAIAILVESGLLYAIVILVAFVAPEVTPRVVMTVVLFRVVAIVPTLMIVQVGLGRHFHSSYMETSIIQDRGDVEATLSNPNRPVIQQTVPEEHPEDRSQP